MGDEKIILNEIGHLRSDVTEMKLDLKEVKGDVKDIRKNFIPSTTFWRIVAALFILAIGSYGSYIL